MGIGARRERAYGSLLVRSRGPGYGVSVGRVTLWVGPSLAGEASVSLGRLREAGASRIDLGWQS